MNTLSHIINLLRHRLLIFFCFFVIACFSAYTQPPLNHGTICDGYISISGNTNISGFRLKAELSNWVLYFDPFEEAFSLKVPLENFKANFEMIESDFQKMLRANIYPQIEIRFPNKNLKNYVLTPVEVIIAGKKITKVIRPEIKTTTDQRSIIGNTEINWKTLGLSPPKRFNGLITIDESINIKFVLNIKNYEQCDLTQK
ncbi:hypothetical protein [Tenuifilum osseticum]|jgi:hypothetical protein|uniref:hypothetical protein n=1 Tax=Tenuifilum TaxID=2760873 RepID=UPI00175075B3